MKPPNRTENAKFSNIHGSHALTRAHSMLYAVCFTSVYICYRRTASMGKKAKAAIQGELITGEASDSASVIGRKSLSLSELTASVPVKDKARLMQRIRHWTREGALLPSEFAHAGRGMHREYGPEASYCVMTLHCMTVAGLPIAH